MSTITSHSLHPQRGFHTTLSTKITLDKKYPACSFFTLYTLPPSIIIDRHELRDHGIDFEFWGESNLELPVFALKQKGNSFLLVDATPTTNSDEVSVDIPVHARYGEPGMAQVSRRSIEISSPACFWACPSSASVPKTFSSKPPIPNSIMLHSSARFSVSPPTSHVTVLNLPVASIHDLSRVELGTAIVVLVAFFWLVYRSCKAASTLQSRHLKEQ